MRARTEAIVIGGSAGSIDALIDILPALPSGFAIPVAIVLHMPPSQPSLLARVLGARCALPVREVEDKDPVAPATVHVAPPNYHLLVERRRTFSLSVDAPVHYSRPSIDVLFESAADAYGSTLLGLLLSGANEDGARGLARIAAMGGVTLVQEPGTSRAPEMPLAALRMGPVDLRLAPPAIGRYLASLGGAETP